MLSLCRQTDGRTDRRTTVKQYAPIFRCEGIKMSQAVEKGDTLPLHDSLYVASHHKNYGTIKIDFV